MPSGLQIFDPNGNVIVDTTTNIGRLLGGVVINSGNQSGSISNAQLSTGTPFSFSSPTSSAAGWNEGAIPMVSFSGTTMSWSMAQPYMGTQGYTFTGTIYFGVA